MKIRSKRGTVTGVCLLFVITGIAVVVARFAIDGGGSYGNIFFPLGIVEVGLLGWSFAALHQFRRGATAALHPFHRIRRDADRAAALRAGHRPP